MKGLHISSSIAALILALLLWVFIGLNDPVQISLSIPVTVPHGTNDEAVITNAPPTVAVTIRSSGWRALRCMFDPTIQLQLPLPPVRTRQTFSTVDALEQMDAFSRGIVIVDAAPHSISVSTEKAVSKRIPITAVTRGKFRDGFDRVGPIIISPDSITVTGASSILATVDRWPTVPILFQDINTPFSSVALLSDSLSMVVHRSVSSALVSFEVQPIAERTITGVPVELIQAPNRKKILLLPGSVDVIIRGGVNALASLPLKDIKASIDYRSILLDTSGTVIPAISTPNNISVVRIVPDKVQYILRQ